MEAHLNLQRDSQSRIFKAYTNYKKSPNSRITTSYLVTRLEDLERLWQQFTFDHQEILKLFDGGSLQKTEYVTEDLYSVTNELYIEYKCALKEQLAKIETLPTFTSTKASSSGLKFNQVKLPRITIPTFSGKYEEWISFRELFISLIHNSKDIDNVQKLHYLKAHLTGEAEQLLRHKPLTSESYEQCWTLLKSRYNNKQFLGNNILSRFFAQKTLFTESATDIKNLLDCTTETLDALSGLGVDTTTWDIIVIYIVSQKLDSESRRQWECKVSEGLSKSEQLPAIALFRDFLQTRYHSLEFMEPKQSCSHNSKYMFNDNKGNLSNVKSTPIQNLYVTNVLCSFCKGYHRIFNCKGFSGLHINEKRNFVQTNGLCFNCLGEGHAVRFCRNTSSCQICNGRHHSLLHHHGESQSVGNGSTDNQAAQVHTHHHHHLPVQEEAIQSTSITNHFVNEVTPQVLLATAVVEVESSEKLERHLLRALIDQGSQASFITSEAVQLLGLKKTPAKGLVSGLGKQNVVSESTVEVTVASRVKPGYVLKVTAYVLQEITSFLPSARITLTDWRELEFMKLADPEYDTPNKIDLLLGAEVYAQIIDTGLIKCPTVGSLVAQNTSLGWILSGQVGLKAKVSCDEVNINHTQVNQLSRSNREMESGLSNNSRSLSPEEQRCEDNNHATTTKDNNSRCIVALMLRDDETACVDGISSEIVLRRFHSLEEEFQGDLHLLENNTKGLHDCREAKHVEHLTESETNKPGVPVNKSMSVCSKPQQDLGQDKGQERDTAYYAQGLWRNSQYHEVEDGDEAEKLALKASRKRQNIHMVDLMPSCKTNQEAIEEYKQEVLSKRGLQAVWNRILESKIGKAGGKQLETKQMTGNKFLRLTWDRGRDEVAFAVQLSITVAVPVAKRRAVIYTATVDEYVEQS